MNGYSVTCAVTIVHHFKNVQARARWSEVDDMTVFLRRLLDGDIFSIYLTCNKSRSSIRAVDHPAKFLVHAAGNWATRLHLDSAWVEQIQLE